jgi:DNA-binding CsgD family transcriptional regulator
MSLLRFPSNSLHFVLIMDTTTHPQLAPKELAYLTGRAHGLSDKEIARIHGVSHRTVEGAMRRILYKLDARKITEAVFKATSEGLLCGVFTLATMLSAVQINPDQPIARVSRCRTSMRIRQSQWGSTDV